MNERPNDRPLVLVSQRVDRIADRGERRDALDQRWAALLAACGLLPIPVCNRSEAVGRYVALPGVAGVLLTGGNDLDALGGDVPEREATETALYRAALAAGLPVLGVCHGMQLIQFLHGVVLAPVVGHVAAVQEIELDGAPARVNSYHGFGTTSTTPDLVVRGRAVDGVVKAVRHAHRRVAGIMWHPERIDPFRREDIDYIGQFFTGP
jgi:N5-(cytidine 5'-diphosphoramidyl)-L-glutamine hydrolase